MASQLLEDKSNSLPLARIFEEEPQILKSCQIYSNETWIRLELRKIRKICMNCEDGACLTKKLL